MTFSLLIIMDHSQISDEELVSLVSPNSEVHKELKRRNILKTKNLVGEIGEYFTFKFFNNNSGLTNLVESTSNIKNIDFIGMNGKRYSVKTVSSRKGTPAPFYKIEDTTPTFDYLIFVILDNSYQLDLILQLTWEDFIKYKNFNSRMNNHVIGVTKKMMSNVEVLYGAP